MILIIINSTQIFFQQSYNPLVFPHDLVPLQNLLCKIKNINAEESIGTRKSYLFIFFIKVICAQMHVKMTN